MRVKQWMTVLACAMLLGVAACGKPQKAASKAAAPAPQVQPPAPEISPAQLYGRWVLAAMNGGAIDPSIVESHNLEFTSDLARSEYAVGSKGKGLKEVGTYRWSVYKSTLTLVRIPEAAERRRGLPDPEPVSVEISLEGNLLVIYPMNPFVGFTDFRRSTVVYRNQP